MSVNDSINRKNNSVRLEVCVGSLEDAVAAQSAGADRVELCGALELGGLTPSIGLVEQVCREVALPVFVMLRPRAAGFAYSESEFRCMTIDAERVLNAGASGIVFGVLDTSGKIDERRIEMLATLAEARETVFHRAFDGIREKEVALETLCRLGIGRVLTSGGPAAAVEGIPMLKRLVSQSAGRIEILPGGGIGAEDVSQLLSETGCSQLHVGASVGRVDPSLEATRSAGLCDLRRLSEGSYRGVDRRAVEQVHSSILEFSERID